MSASTIYNAIRVSDEILTSGQPTAHQLRALAAEGFTNVINLFPFEPSISLENEAELVEALGLNYFSIPVVWDNPQESDYRTFVQTMNQLPVGRTLIHCAANLRVTVFYALYAQENLGWSPAQAEQFRARIWEGRDYPVWREFIARMTEKITSG